MLGQFVVALFHVGWATKLWENKFYCCPDICFGHCFSIFCKIQAPKCIFLLHDLFSTWWYKASIGQILGQFVISNQLVSIFWSFCFVFWTFDNEASANEASVLFFKHLAMLARCQLPKVTAHTIPVLAQPSFATWE